MKLKHKKPRLKFVEIAAKWAAEDGDPGQDRYLHELVKSNWLGDFEDEEGQSYLFLINDDGEEVEINRCSLLNMLATFSKQTVFELESKGIIAWDGRQTWTAWLQQAYGDLAKASDLWNQLAAVGLENYDPLFREVYLERMSILRFDFQLWCHHRQYDIPPFWGEVDVEEILNTGIGDQGKSVPVDNNLRLRERKNALQQLANKLRKENPTFSKQRIAIHIFKNNDIQKHKGEGKLSSDAIEREIVLPRWKL